jgi:protein TonB
MFRNEIQPENHMERSTALPVHSDSQAPEVQRKRMLIALGILLAALAAVVLKDWDFWFPSAGEVQQATFRKKSRTVTPTPAVVSTAPPREHKVPKPSAPPVATDAPPFSATTERAALPPLQVEVVAGNRHIDVPAKSNAIHLDVESSTPSVSAAPADPNSATKSGEHVQLSPQTAQSVSISVPLDYPLLARQMKVQGVVSLQALISRDGTIQQLKILSGPGILAAAAREAVKQWHFKPFLQNGQPVETQARITVNFTISTN